MANEESAGFAGAAQGLQAISQQTQWINQQVGEGKLRLDPQAADAAAKHCEDEIEALRDLVEDAHQLSYLRGLGDYASGKQLTQRFLDKATDKDAGALALLRDMQDELQKQADAFRNAGKDTQATDEQVSQDMQRGMQQ